MKQLHYLKAFCIILLIAILTACNSDTQEPNPKPVPEPQPSITEYIYGATPNEMAAWNKYVMYGEDMYFLHDERICKIDKNDHVEIISEEEMFSKINIINGKIYGCGRRDDWLFETNMDTSSKRDVIWNSNKSDYLVVNNWIYYLYKKDLGDPLLYKYDMLMNKEFEVIDKPIKEYNVIGEVIYYIEKSKDNHNIYQYDQSDGSHLQLTYFNEEENACGLIANENEIYITANYSNLGSHRFYKYDILKNELIKIKDVDLYVYTFNVKNGWIYFYCDNEKPDEKHREICKFDIDGNNFQTLYTEFCIDVFVTDKHIYFFDYTFIDKDAETAEMYNNFKRIDLDGSNLTTVYTEAPPVDQDDTQ